jgi:hypothetical protein
MFRLSTFFQPIEILSQRTRYCLFFFSGMVYHFSDLFQYISSGSKENLAEWQVRLKAKKIETS